MKALRNYLSFLCITLACAVGIASCLAMGLGLYANLLGDWRTCHALFGAPFLAILPMMVLGFIGETINSRD